MALAIIQLQFVIHSYLYLVDASSIRKLRKRHALVKGIHVMRNEFSDSIDPCPQICACWFTLELAKAMLNLSQGSLAQWLAWKLRFYHKMPLRSGSSFNRSYTIVQMQIVRFCSGIKHFRKLFRTLCSFLS